jgi:hypothetical protein
MAMLATVVLGTSLAIGSATMSMARGGDGSHGGQGAGSHSQSAGSQGGHGIGGNHGGGFTGRGPNSFGRNGFEAPDHDGAQGSWPIFRLGAQGDRNNW